MEKVDTYKVICGGGLNKRDNWIELSDQHPGQAIFLRNFEPSLFGGYRRINGYQPLSEDFPEVSPSTTQGRILGVMFVNNHLICARKNSSGNTYSFWKYNPLGSWINVSNGYSPVYNNSIKIRYDTFNFDGVEKIVAVDGVNPPVIFDGTNWTPLSGDQLDTLIPKYVAVYKNHIFVAGDAAFPHIVAHSAPNDETDWAVANGAGQIFAGFSVVQIEPWRDRLIVFGYKEIKYIAVSNTTFTIDSITKNLGCISSDSVVEANGDLLFLSNDGVRPISATERNEDFELSSISKNIQSILESSLFNTTLNNVNAVTLRKKSQVRFFLSHELENQESARGLLVGLMPSPNGVRWEWAELRGIKLSCVNSGYINGKEYVIHGGYDGLVYHQDVGNSFNGSNISALYATPFLDYGNPMLRKTLKSVKLFYRPEGDIIFDVGIAYDWNDRKNMNNISPPFEFMESSNFSYYNQVIYNQSYYSGLPISFTFRNITGSGFSNNFVFACNNQLPPFSIQSIIVEYTPNGHE